MMDTVNERSIAIYKKSKARSVRSYALKIGVPPTTLNECIKGSESRFSLLKSILDGEPSISAEWLIRGKRNMETSIIISVQVEELKAEINQFKGENCILRE